MFGDWTGVEGAAELEGKAERVPVYMMLRETVQMVSGLVCVQGASQSIETLVCLLRPPETPAFAISWAGTMHGLFFFKDFMYLTKNEHRRGDQQREREK